MDRYDAILEHLKKAQIRGLDSVSSSLDSVVTGLEELINAAKSTVQNAAPENPEECFPIGDVAAAIKELCDSTARTTGISLELLRTLDRTRSQSELLRELLPILAQHVGRAVVLVIRNSSVSAWSGIGFADGEKLRSWQGEFTSSPALQNLVDNPSPLEFVPAEDQLFAEWLATDRFPDDAVLFPIFLRGKLMGTMYVDHYGDEKWDIDTAQSLVAVSCWLIDTLHHRKEVPTPMLGEITHFEAVAARILVDEEPIAEEPFSPKPEPSPPVEDTAFIESAPEPEIITEPKKTEAPSFELEEDPRAPTEAEPDEISFEAPEPEAVDFGVPDETSSSADADLPVTEQINESYEPILEGGGIPPDFDPSATMRVDVGQIVGAPVIPEEPPAEAVPEKTRQFDDQAAPPKVEPVQPPEETAAPSPPEGTGSPELSPEDEARHEEARRFARLLVSEIKLYNEDEVERGRASNDLYQRLQEDIDRSREMYEKRIPEDIRAGGDYFREEIVRILADGNDSALGM